MRDDIKEKLYYIWLSQLYGFGPITINNLIKNYGNPFKLYNMDKDELNAIRFLNKNQKKTILNNKDLSKALEIIKKCKEKDIGIITYDEYGEKLRNDKITPVLYYKGTINAELSSLTITGSTFCTDYGRRVLDDLIQFTSINNINIISGFSRGIEAYAHGICINKGGKTYAFLCNGIDICYPKEHLKLYSKIIENGALLSQFPPGEKPKKYNIFKRNLLMCQCSEKIIIIEAGAESRVLDLADNALAMGKEVYAVPGDIFNPNSKGTNNLLSRGAKIYQGYKELYPNYKDKAIQIKILQKTDKKSVTTKEQGIINYLSKSIATIDEIAINASLSTEKVAELLCIMEIEGAVKQVVGGRWMTI